MKTIVLASNNQHKVLEYQKILKNYKLITLKDLDYQEEIEENGHTFAENALIKASTIHNYLKEQQKDYIVLAEDSGLCINALNGAPGIYSARYSGVHGNSLENRKRVLKELDGVDDRSAYFMCAIVVYFPNGEYQTFTGRTDGSITKEERGRTDFGYDAIFLSDDLDCTFGEATEEEKNSVSHRGRAIEEMLKFL
ncbi:MAG: RdgB/HAM1 family non-canonical purine NTP pyrophosphatase [Bacilli bacterium]|nr:RdgB/HAM1 family non-canonical purine NTP pyrophosphatase [Bacilli bacterium]